MSKNVPWTNQVENEFRSRVKFTSLEDKVFTLHMSGDLTQKQMADVLGISVATVNSTLRSVKYKYKRAMIESDTLPPFFSNKSEMIEWQKRSLAREGKYSTSDVSRLIDEWIFDEKARKITKRRMIDNVTFERLAEEFDMSVRQIKNIVSYCEEKVYRKMN